MPGYQIINTLSLELRRLHSSVLDCARNFCELDSADLRSLQSSIMCILSHNLKITSILTIESLPVNNCVYLFWRGGQLKFKSLLLYLPSDSRKKERYINIWISLINPLVISFFFFKLECSFCYATFSSTFGPRHSRGWVSEHKKCPHKFLPRVLWKRGQNEKKF